MSENEQATVLKTKKRFYQKPWFWVMVAIVGIIVIASPKNSPKSDSTKTNTASVASTSKSISPAPATKVQPEQPAVPAEYKSALSQADSYANTMHMSKQGVYDQLVSQYGGKFTPEAAQYAIDNVKSDWNNNALAKAKDYQDSMHMSPAAIHDQLTSQYGEKFTSTEADYAIQHLND